MNVTAQELRVHATYELGELGPEPLDPRQRLNRVAAPGARAAGAKAGFWLAPAGGRGVSVTVYETEGEAREVAKMFEVGKPPTDEMPADVTVRTVEVREVLASV
jgi:hypothetical protein